MSNYIGYKPEDNFRRKSNNTTDELGWGQNNNVKQYSTKPGQLSAKQQADAETKRQRALNRKQPVKRYTPEEIQAMNMQYGLTESA